MFDLISEITQTLKNNKLRTSLTGFAVAWGIFMLIILLGMSRGVFNSFNESRRAQGANSITVWGGQTAKPFRGYKEGRTIQLKDPDIEIIELQNGTMVEAASSAIQSDGSVIISTNDDYITSGYEGVFTTELESKGENIYLGRFINENDIKERRRVVVLTKKNADILFPDSTKIIGGQVIVNGLAFTVVGLINPEWGQRTYIPYTTAKLLNGNSDNVSQINVTLKNISTIEEGEKIEDDVRKTLSHRHEFDPSDQSAVWIWNRFKNHMTMNSALGILDMVVWLIGIFTMLSGIVGVSNIMFVSVRERTHEIGIRRAIGAKPRNILIQILTESVAITAIFGYIGVFLGIIVTELLSKAFSGVEFIKNPTIDISIAINVTIVLIIAGCLAGLFPALKALKVKPVEALRDE